LRGDRNDPVNSPSMRDTLAFTRLYNQYNRQIYRYAFGMCRDKHLARDLTQDAFKQLWDGFWRVKDDGHAANFLYLVVKHLFLQHSRKTRVGEKVILGLSTLTDELPGLPEELPFVTEEAYAALEAAIGRLSPQRQQVLEMLFREELAIETVAARLQVKAQTVRNHKTQLLDRLRSEFKKNMFFE
jgi:RNA polymerase sigma factor (sigma-70 family)